MNLRLKINDIIFIVILLVLQATTFYRFGLFDWAFCFAYIGIILLAPPKSNKLALLALAFVLGVIIGLYYERAGIHSAALVLIAFVRLHLLRLFHDFGTDNDFTISPTEMGFGNWMLYVLLGSIIHHLVIFMLEWFLFSNFFENLFMAVVSAIFTTAVIFMAQLATRIGHHKSR